MIKKTLIIALCFLFILEQAIYASGLPAAQIISNLPSARQFVPLSPALNPPVFRGLKFYPDDPLRFDFILEESNGRGGEPQPLRKSLRVFLPRWYVIS